MRSNSANMLNQRYQSLPPQCYQQFPNQTNQTQDNQTYVITNSKRQSNNQQSVNIANSNIKIVENIDSSPNRNRNRRIFNSKSNKKGISVLQNSIPQNNPSISLTNSKPNEFAMINQKVNNIQVTPIRYEPVINKFIVPYINPSSVGSNPIKVIRVDNILDSPLQLSTKRVYNPIQDRIREKQRQLSYLKLQLERYQRCQNLSTVNQGIYKSLLKDLDKSRNQLQQINSYHKIHKRRSNQYQKSPKTARNQSTSFQQTNRYLQWQNNNLKELLNSKMNKKLSFGQEKDIDVYGNINNRDFLNYSHHHPKCLFSKPERLNYYFDQNENKSTLAQLNNKLQIRLDRRNSLTPFTNRNTVIPTRYQSQRNKLLNSYYNPKVNPFYSLH